jgi:hypothetical protein
MNSVGKDAFSDLANQDMGDVQALQSLLVQRSTDRSQIETLQIVTRYLSKI